LNLTPYHRKRSPYRRAVEQLHEAGDKKGSKRRTITNQKANERARTTMERTKSQYIKELIETAQDNIWKCELKIKLLGEATSNADKEQLNAAKLTIEKDTEYIAFLKGELALCESSE
jgi:hypothetical protein